MSRGGKGGRSAGSPRVPRNPRARAPRPFIVAVGGPNGAGKTTIARAVLPTILGVTDFVNADAIATGLSGVRPELAALAKVRRGRKGLVPRPF